MKWRPITAAELAEMIAAVPTVVGTEGDTNRLTSEWVGKVISRIGEEAAILVASANEHTGRPAKFASAPPYDRRRSCCERLREAGVPLFGDLPNHAALVVGNHPQVLRARQYREGCRGTA